MTRPLTLPSPWLELAAKAGSLKALAEAFGVTPMSVWRWSKGKPVHPHTRAAVNAWARRRGLVEPFAEPEQ